MLSKMPSFRDYDFENITELNGDLQDSKFLHQSPLNPKLVVDPTALYEHDIVEDFHFSRSLNNAVRDYQISFQAEFMEQHQNAFKKQTENFIESSFKFSGDKTITYESEEIFGENLEFGTFSEDEESLLRFEENIQFLKTIQNEEKLNQFMDYIFKTVPKEFASQFVYLASIAWTRYSANKDIIQTIPSISQKAKQLAEMECERLFEDQRIKFLNFKIVSTSELNSEILIKDAFKTYLKFFFATVVLVGEEFFENPYGQAECAKRERSYRLEDDLDDDNPSSTNSIQCGMPTKRLHFY